MPYGKVKIYSDGSHYIGIPYIPNPNSIKKNTGSLENNASSDYEEIGNFDTNDKTQKESNIQDSKSKIVKSELECKKVFEELYSKYNGLSKAEKMKLIIQDMAQYFESEETASEYVAVNMERKQRNLICRKIRLYRKVNMQTFNYFVTFTYDDKIHTEDTFKKTLRNCLQHYSSRRGWKYIGVWERSPEKKRLHFHAIMHIPNDAIPGEFVQTEDYDTKSKRKQITMQNSFFGKKFGRNDFRVIENKFMIPQTIAYMTKYLEKTGEKLVYSRGLYQYIISDIMDEDIICHYGIDDRKLLLFDNFTCWDEGEYIGEVSPKVIARMPKSN